MTSPVYMYVTVFLLLSTCLIEIVAKKEVVVAGYLPEWRYSGANFER